MNVRGFFKNVLSNEPDAANSQTATEVPKTGAASGMTSFLSGTSRFLDSVQTKKNGLINDLSNKLSSIKLPGDQSGTGTQGKKRKKRSASNGQRNSGDEESSASEYGDDGDRPMYAEQPPVERRVSVDSVASLPEDEVEQWKSEISKLVSSIFEQKPIGSEMKANFQNFVTQHTGRSLFAKELRYQMNTKKAVAMPVLTELSQYTSHVLVNCNETDDFGPATQLLQATFTIYHEITASSMEDHSKQHYLFTLLRDQPIWQSMRFWNAAFFIALQAERRKQTIPTELHGEEALEAEKEAQDNAVYIQLSKFLWRMCMFGIPKEACMDFLRKQASAENLSQDKYYTLQMNVQQLFQNEEETE
ncbi:hypothetical protein PHET_00691 [Paragonimus heterotremus]|uniref:SBF1/SBF2 domain-containing protein n=1 Tax=Paragonimus heterotremus TaxID=100268 RepID=A0A8J4TSG5_9TREM|nr:hypothetical protein PHET_00691 [Paragonimus heterotremus]